jgi:cell division septation protein DedD
LEQQAKERLTGGVILVVLLVLLVPELLTGPRPAPPAVPVQPDQAPMRSYTMQLGESAPTNSAPIAASTAASAAREAPVPVSSSPVALSAPGPAVAAQTPTLAAPAAPPPPPVPSAAPRSAQHTPPAHPAEHGAGWTVQVGTFSSRENAAHLVASLKSHGFSANVSEATKEGHKLFRVRVGNERDRAAAQKLLARLKAAGQKGGEIEQTSSTIPRAVPAARRP